MDVLNHRALGYCFDTEPVVGIALDQTGSMTGPTPDPLTGMPPNISKWNAAKQGVGAFLHDCESAYAAAEAYVTGGVQTFRTTGGGNTFTKIFVPGTPYGIVKSGSSYSQATFNANIAPESPAGGTPLADALSDTESTLVRAPFANQPASEQRYMVFLTDGKETAGAPLSSLAAGGLADTAIFAMGFGVGSGWDGVDYATIANLVSKGKTLAGVTQVYHGDNAGAIDKFYTNSIAAAIGYVPFADPQFELFAGEHLHYRFAVTDAEQALMIAAQGFDFNDQNWDFCLIAPNGAHCCDTREGDQEHGPTTAPPMHAGHDHGGTDDSAKCPCLATLRKQNARCTIFVNRNGAAGEIWIGTWTLMVMYRAKGAGEGAMLMTSLADLLFPSGAPPVKGPLYTRFNQPVRERPAVRAMPGIAAHPLATSQGSSTTNPDPPCALSVNIYSKTTLKPRLIAQAKSPFAGSDVDLILAGVYWE